MKVLGIKLQKAGLIMMSIAGIIVGMSGCEDRLDTPRPPMPEGKSVDVSLCVGIADEEDAASSGSGSSSTKSVGDSGFSVNLVSIGETKAITVADDPLATAKPDRLYGLEVWQYDRSGNFVKNKGASLGHVEIGSSFNVTLTAMNDCQLLIIARGYDGSDYTVCTLKDRSLSFVQDTTALASAIEGITTKEGIKAMPYILHLPHVNVTDDGKIQNPEGTDIRILLRRLATRLTVAWENLPANTGYDLKQVILQSIPVKYKLLPNNKDSYPSLLDQYKTIQIPDISDKGRYTCWIPAVVRGKSTNATSDYYRTKANAPKGSAYATFISQNKTDSKKKLNYRVYLGGSSSKDFSLYGNANYIYKVTMDHTSLPVDDKRVTIIDPIPASVNNNNLVPTANCFMVVPGGAFCFNPYKYNVKGATGENTLLQNWCGVSGGTATKPIKSVKVLWQTLEDGDLGDPVLGVVNTYAPGTADDDHTNVVSLVDNSSVNDARIYCRVAPNTTGGSGAIAAYSGENGTGDILWSWHIWVTDYSPDPLGNTDVSTPVEKRKQKYVNSSQGDQLPMMDRNLGAMAGYTEVPTTELERSKANGFHYQWGRKDPFRSSYSSKKIPSIIAQSIDKPIDGLMSLYKGDGVTFFPMKTVVATIDYRGAYKAPYDMYKLGSSTNKEVKRWYSGNSSDTEYANSWGQTGDKGLHDPCPAGWRVCSHINYRPLFGKTDYAKNINCVNPNSLSADGGALLYYDKTNGKTSYFRFVGYWIYGNEFGNIGLNSFLWCREKTDKSTGTGGYHLLLSIVDGPFSTQIIDSGWEQEALLVRCIQERAN